MDRLEAVGETGNEENETLRTHAQGPPAGPVFGTLLFHCRGAGFIPVLKSQAILSRKRVPRI